MTGMLLGMKHMGKNRNPVRRRVCALCCLLGAFGQLSVAAAGGLLDYVEVDIGRKPAEIHIHFTHPVRYVSHRPTNSADFLTIQLQPVSASEIQRDRLLGRAFLSWKPTDRVPLREVTMDVDSISGYHVIVEFENEVRYIVRPTPGMQTLIIQVMADTPSSGTADIGTTAPASSDKAVPRIYESDTGTPDVGASYAINLESSLHAALTLPAIDENLLSDYTLYTTEFELDGRIWHRTRLGFFATPAAAANAFTQLADTFPDAWITRISAEERESALAQLLVLSGAAGSATPAATPVRAPATDTKTVPSAGAPESRFPDLSEEKLLALLEDARQSTARGNYARSIQIYTRIIESPANAYRQDALEFLGVARERNGQLAHAKAEYERYLGLYPEGDGTERVRQRLFGLITAAEPAKPRLRATKQSQATAQWKVFGGVSQFYRRAQSELDDRDAVVSVSGLFNDVDINLRRRSSSYDVRTRLTGDFIYDVLDEGTGNQTHITSAYVNVTDIERGFSLRAGRQTLNSSGVLGRFDGLLLGYEIFDSVRVNGVAGFPVESTGDAPDTDRKLYGISLDLGTFGNVWDFIPYFIEQSIDGISDRRAVGMETHYFDSSRSFVNLIDYDVSYSELNNFYFFGNWTFPNRLTLNGTLDYRKSPLLTTYNALIGQPVSSIGELLEALPEEDIRQLARDRTADNRTISLGLAYPLTEKLQLNGDVTATELTETIASGGVDGTPGTDVEIYYATQLIGSSIFRTGDSLVIGLRYVDATTSETTTAHISSRFPLSRTLRVSPRLRVNYRLAEIANSTQWILLPSLRIDYRRRKNLLIEFEAGYEFNDTDTSLGDQEMTSHYFSLGYRTNF